MISVEAVSGSTALYRFKLSGSHLGVGIPYTGAVFKSWPHKSLVCLSFDSSLPCSHIPLHKAKGLIGFGTDIINMGIPPQIPGYCDTKVFGGSNILKDLPVKNIVSHQ